MLVDEISMAMNSLKEVLILLPQLAIDRYNIDIAIHKPTIALEVFGGYWHFYGRHAGRFAQRCKYITDSGFTIVIVVIGRNGLNTGLIGDYIVALSQKLSSDPSSASKAIYD